MENPDQASDMPNSEIVPPRAIKRKKKPAFNPNLPYKNPKYEIMARELAKGSSQVDAYRKAYPKASNTSVNALASNCVRDHGINERALRLLERAGLSEAKLASKLNEHVDSDTAQISLDAVKTGFKLIGYGQEQKIAESSYNPTQIIIENVQIHTQPPIDKEDTAK